MDSVKANEDAIAALRAARDAQLREFAAQEASLQSNLEAAKKAAEDQKAEAGPDSSVGMYMVRISPASKKPMKDFGILQEEVRQSGEGFWDKDHQNKLKVGDYLAFIVGNKPEQKVYFFKIKKEMDSNNRPSHWASQTPYTNGNGIDSVKHRQVIVLTESRSYSTMTWITFKEILGLSPNCSSWMPRGTTRVVNKYKLD